MNTRTPRAVRALAVGSSLFAAACGSDDDATPAMVGETVETATPPTTGETGTDAVDSTDPTDGPQRIVSLSPTHTEMLFAIGAGDRLVAVAEFSNFLAEALDLPNELSGF